MFLDCPWFQFNVKTLLWRRGYWGSSTDHLGWSGLKGHWTGLFLKFSMRIMLIIQWRFSCCWTVLTTNQVLPVWRWVRGWLEAWPAELAQNGIFIAHRTSCPVHKVGGIDWGQPSTTGGQAGHQSLGGEQQHCVSLLSPGFYFSHFVVSLFVTTGIIEQQEQ